jgi:hypothetical protein
MLDVARKTGERSAERISWISGVFNGLVRSTTLRRPSVYGLVNRPDLKLTRHERRSINFIISSTTPEELASIVFNQPPGVFALVGEQLDEPVYVKPPSKIVVKPSPENELKLAHQELVIPDEVAEESRPFVDMVLSMYRKYLSSPIIDDGFTDHSRERRPWERGIYDALVLISKAEKELKIGNRQWEQIFKSIFDNNRYGSIRGNLVFSLMNLQIVPLPENLRNLFDQSLLRITEANKIFDAGEIEKGAALITEECINVLGLFAVTNGPDG